MLYLAQLLGVTMRKFSPDTFTFDDFGQVVTHVLNSMDEIENFSCHIEDSVPWIVIEGKKVIRPQKALAIMQSLQSNIVDEVLFNSLNGRELKLVVNGKFHFSKREKSLHDFDEEYAHEYGCTAEEMKEEYELK